MLTILIAIINLLLIFWLISLVWNQKIAQRVFKVVIYLSLIIAVIFIAFSIPTIYRLASLVHEATENSINTAKIINAASLPPADQVNN